MLPEKIQALSFRLRRLFDPPESGISFAARQGDSFR